MLSIRPDHAVKSNQFKNSCIIVSLLLCVQLVSGTTYFWGVGGSGAAGSRSGLRQWYTLHQSQHVTEFIIGNTERQQRKLPRHFVPGRRVKQNIAAFSEAPLVNSFCNKTTGNNRNKKSQTEAYFAMRESVTTMARLKMTFRSTGSRMWSGDCFCFRAFFQSPSVTTRETMFWSRWRHMTASSSAAVNFNSLLGILCIS